MECFIAFTLLSCLSTAYALPSPHTNSTSCQQIQWGPCGDIETTLRNISSFPFPIQCARLPVPLDYTDPNAGQLELDLLKVDAIREPVLGSVLFDSGGPGGSNIDAVAFLSDQLHHFLGGNYNLIGWDPRGTGRTLPFNCSIPGGPTQPPAANQRRDATIQRNMTEYLFNGGWDSAVAYADTCYEKMSDRGRLIGTPFVVRDMVNIVDALGEGGLLNYWGLSYGTQLGSTFAAMFPQRVGRMLLDSVTNPHEYVAGTWSQTMLETDKLYLDFLSGCAAHPDQCSLAPFVGPNATAEDLRQTVNAALQQLLDLQDNTLTYGLSKLGIMRSLYDPAGWPGFSDYLVSTLNNTPIVPPTQPTWSRGPNAFDGISCSDSTFFADGPEDLVDIIREQSATSSFSDVFFDLFWRCAAWKMRAKEQYTGDFVAKTNFPILLVSGIYDPVTPLPSAYNTSSGFEGSRVLIHTGYGHGLIYHPSTCVANAITAYFNNGTLPEPDVICEADLPVWDYIAQSVEAAQSAQASEAPQASPSSQP